MSRVSNILASFLIQARMGEGRVLDVGCGTGTFGMVLAAVRRTHKPYLVGVDIHFPYLLMTPHNIYDDLVQASASKLPFREKSFDYSTSIAVIEHLDKEKGYQMIEEMERVTKKFVGIMTTKGYIPKPTDEDNPYQQHLSAWYEKDFKSRGYKVRFLPDFRAIQWMFIPFFLTYLLGIRAKLIIALKYFE